MASSRRAHFIAIVIALAVVALCGSLLVWLAAVHGDAIWLVLTTRSEFQRALTARFTEWGIDGRVDAQFRRFDEAGKEIQPAERYKRRGQRERADQDREKQQRFTHTY